MASEPKSQRCTLPYVVASKQSQNGSGCNQTNKRALKTNKHKPTKGKQTRTWQRPRSKQTSMDLKEKAWKRANKAQKCKKELIQTLY